MNVTAARVRGYRLRAHHLDGRLPPDKAAEAAGACGLQNTPPGAWETALFHRLEGCTLQGLEEALYGEKSLLQAWSIRGAPMVFPTGQSDIFLTPLIAREGEQPWIYTQGIAGALDALRMSFDDLLQRTMEAARCLDGRTVRSKAALDRTLADIIQQTLPEDRIAAWRAPSMYGSPDTQTVGDAAVSFLLRPCSFHSLVVFGERQGSSPAFTSFRNWTGRAPSAVPEPGKELVRKFLRCYGPATETSLMSWLGCSRAQARRLWDAVAEETVPVRVEGRACRMLEENLESLLSSGEGGERLLLLGAHDPYLDMRDRTVILESRPRHRAVWQYVSNPGVILKGGRIVGTWRTKTINGKLDASLTLWEEGTCIGRQALEGLLEEYAAFRMLGVRSCLIESG